MEELIFIFLFFPVIWISINMKQWGSYKKTYKALPTFKYTRIDNLLVGYDENHSWINSNFSWNVETNTFNMGGLKYLFNGFSTYLDPYSFYWYIKFKRYCRKYLYTEYLTQPNSPKSL